MLVAEGGRDTTTRSRRGDARQAEEAVAAAVERFGAVEEVSDAEARAIFDTNVFGLLTVTRAVLPPDNPKARPVGPGLRRTG